MLDADADLALDDFAGELLGVRVTSVGTDDGSDDDHDWDWGWKHDWRPDSKGGSSNWASNGDWHAKWKEFKDDCKRSDHDGDDGKGGHHHGKGQDGDHDQKDGRDGSAKLVGRISDPIIPVPEPDPALLPAFGLGALAWYAARQQPRRYSSRPPSSTSVWPVTNDEAGAREVDHRARHLVGRGDPVQRRRRPRTP